MWSLIYMVEVAMRKNEFGKRTKKCQNGSWDFCMAEITNDHEYDEYFISHNIASEEGLNAKLVAWPSSVDNPNFKVGYRTSWHNAATARENYRFLSTILDKQLKYSELDEETKAFVDEYKNKNYLKIENDAVEFYITRAVINKTAVFPVFDCGGGNNRLKNRTYAERQECSVDKRRIRIIE